MLALSAARHRVVSPWSLVDFSARRDVALDLGYPSPTEFAVASWCFRAGNRRSLGSERAPQYRKTHWKRWGLRSTFSHGFCGRRRPLRFQKVDDLRPGSTMNLKYLVRLAAFSVALLASRGRSSDVRVGLSRDLCWPSRGDWPPEPHVGG